MYLQFFGLTEAPFSITPDPAFVYLSAEHREALAHLLYGVGQGGAGGFVQLTGEVGTGKTTLCRCLLEQLPEVQEELQEWKAMRAIPEGDDLPVSQSAK